MQEQEPSSQSNSNRTLLLAGAGLVLLTCACFLVVAGVIVVDPFGLNLLDFLRGDRDLAAKSMPPDTSFYLSVDLARFGDEDARRIFQVFLDRAKETDILDEDEIRSDLDTELEQALGVNLTEDILPWMGRSAGLGISGLTVNDFGEPENLEWILALATRDEEASDRFLQDLQAGLTREIGQEPEIEEHLGTTIKEWSSGNDPLEAVAIASAGDQVLLGSGSDALTAVLEAQQGDSLADTDHFRDILAELPGKRALSFYVDSAEYGELFSGLSDEVDLPFDLGEQVSLPTGQAGASLSFVEQGIRFDVAALRDPESLSEQEAETIEATAGDLTLVEDLPDDTIFYLAGRAVNIIWDNTRDRIIEGVGEEEFADLIGDIESEFGVNLDTGLLQLLDEEWALAIMPASGGVIADQFDVPWAFAFMAGTTQPDLLRGTVSDLSSNLETQGLDVRSQEVNDGLDFRIVVDPAGDSSLAYGIRRETLFLVTDEGAVDRLFGNGPALGDFDGYRDVRRAFPANRTPTFYLNVEALLESIEDSPAAGELDEVDEAFYVLRPISVLAAGSHAELDRQHSTVIIFIEAE